MALPVGVQTCEVNFGPFTTFDGLPVPGTVTFVPSRSLLWVATGTPVLKSTLTATLNENGTGSIPLPYTNQSGFSDGQGNSVTNWTYRAVFALGGGVEPPSPVSFLVPLGPSSMDLDLTTPQTSSTGQTVALPVVLSVNGQTGNVTVAGGTGGSGASTLAGINDMSPFARDFNTKTDGPTMRTKIGAGTASTKSDVGLANASDTSDANKPISNLQAAALAKTVAIVRQVGASYPTPIPTGFGSIRYIGNTDPATQGITLTLGDEWISLAI